MILGTAGHVDHGKTALVKALTGVDTDRLEEEKRRGITIDLGFAPLHLGDGTTLGVVDVPGHEAFVRNMLAGATGVDLALLVIAADEGIMPQTREHLAILTLLGIRGGVIALTKTDLVDAEWLELVRDDVRREIAGTPLEGAPLVATSVVSGAGLEELRDALSSAARALPSRNAEDLFRMPVDRAFTVRGTGTVVTGTVWSGTLERDAIVRLLPGTTTARVRGIESHGAPVERASPGTRAAIALAGVDVSLVGRGTMLVSDPAWTESRRMLAEVSLLDDAPLLGPRTRVRFHLGTLDVGARLVAVGGALRGGERRAVRVVLNEPVVARAGDRFVLRSASPVATIGGGVVHDPLPPQRRSRPAISDDGAAPSLSDVVFSSGATGMDISLLPIRTGLPPREVRERLARLPQLRSLGARVYALPVLERLSRRLIDLVDRWHATAPLDPGAPLQLLRSEVGAGTAVVDELLRELEASGTLETRGAVVRRHGWRPSPSAHQARLAWELTTLFRQAGREPPATSELIAERGEPALAVLRYLERDGSLIQVEADRYYEEGAVRGMVAALRTGMAAGREYSPSDLRALLGFSRKYLIPFLEYCDRTGVTERRPGGRVVTGGS
ncbi:MAG: selenocysteine-specific translation elongation factor [Gemmatimonadota bacterium]|nr:selenocysteine-specific translation elongation factor [Gemmatimonadota bacterium]